MKASKHWQIRTLSQVQSDERQHKSNTVTEENVFFSKRKGKKPVEESELLVLL